MQSHGWTLPTFRAGIGKFFAISDEENATAACKILRLRNVSQHHMRRRRFCRMPLWHLFELNRHNFPLLRSCRSRGRVRPAPKDTPSHQADVLSNRRNLLCLLDCTQQLSQSSAHLLDGS